MALKVTIPAFQGLTGSVGDSSWIGEWEKLEMKAMKKRGEAMMIYNVSPVPGPFSFFGGVQPLLISTYSRITGRKAAQDPGQDIIKRCR